MGVSLVGLLYGSIIAILSVDLALLVIILTSRYYSFYEYVVLFALALAVLFLFIVNSIEWSWEICSTIDSLVKLHDKVDELSSEVENIRILLNDLVRAIGAEGPEAKELLRQWVLKAKRELEEGT